MAINIESPGGSAAALKEAILDIILPNITADDGATGEDGVDIILTGGAGNGEGGGGDVSVVSGAGGAEANGGAVQINGGAGGATSGAGGSIQVVPGDGLEGNGGDLALRGGSSYGGDGNGGNVYLIPGDPEGTGVAGHVVITASISAFNDDAAAATGGVPVGGLYRTASAIKIRVA